MKKILVVAESLDVNDSSGTKGRVALIQNLCRLGHDLVVYHYTLKEIQLEGVPCIAIRENRKSILFFLSRTERYFRDYLHIRLYKPLQKFFGFSFTLFNDRNSIVKALKEITDFEPDLVLTLSKGGSFRPHHALLKIPEWHSKWLAYMHDPYPMHHYPKPFTWTEPGFRQKENFIRAVSEKVGFSAFPSLYLKEWMGKFYPGFLKTGVIIPHQIINVPTKNVELPEYFIPGKFSILHAGNLLGARNPKDLIAAYEDFLERQPEAKNDSQLLFIGGNNKRVKAMARNNPNIFASEAYVNFEVVYKMQQKATVNIILEAKAEVSPFLPGKFPHCISADKPILLLGPEKSEAKRLLGESYPWWSEIDDLQKITALLEEMYLAWKDSPENFNLDRPDLINYLSEPYLEEVIEGIR